MPRYHQLNMTARIEGEPLDTDDLQKVAKLCASAINQVLSERERRLEGTEFCDLGVGQHIDITV